jgi:hypothetical protein
MVANFGRGKDKAPRKKRANLRNHALGGAIVGGIAGNALTKPITVPIELVGGLAGSAIGAGAGAATYGARRAWRGGKALVAKLRGKEPEKYDYMKSLNRMTAEFARGKDKQKRKQRSLTKSILKGAAIGAVAPVALGTLAGGALGGVALAKLGKAGRQALAAGPMGKNAAAKMVGSSALLGGTAGTLGIGPGVALGAAGGAGAYGISRMRNKNRESKSPLQSARKRLGL